MWRKSSYSGVNGNCLEWAFTKSTYSTNSDCLEAAFRKSSWCQGGECAEAAVRDGVVLVRDSRDPDGPVLPLPIEDWAAFVKAIKAALWASGGSGRRSLPPRRMRRCGRAGTRSSWTWWTRRRTGHGIPKGRQSHGRHDMSACLPLTVCLGASQGNQPVTPF